MKDKFLKKRKKYAVALLAATAATVATSFSPSAPWVMASGGESDGPDPNLPPDFNPPVYNDVDPKAYYYHVQGSENVTVEPNTFKAEDYNGDVVTFNNFIVKANDTLVEDSDDIVVDQGESEHATHDGTNGVTRKYKLKLSETLKNELKAAAGGSGGGAAPSKLEAGTNTTVEGDGTATPYKVNLNSDLTGITSITGDTLTLHGGATTVAISDNGVDVGGKKITNLKEGDVSENSTDAVTGKQLHETNEKVEAKLDKAAERHIKPGDYTVENGTVTLKYVDADGTETGEEATISGLNPVKSVASGNTDAITVDNNNGDITITPVVAADITKADDANKLVTAGVVNTAINNAIEPLADKNLSNITDAGKKVITGLGTEVVQGDGVTVTSDVDATTGKKTYTISAVKPKFAAGSNTTVDGNGTDGNEYTVNVKSDLTGITSITGDNGLTFTGAGTAVTINGDGVDVGGKKITNLKEGDVSESSTDAVTGKQLNATNTKVANLEANKLDKTDDVHVQAGKYSVAEDGTVTLPLVKGEADTATGKNVVIDGIVTKAVLSAEVDKHDLNIAGDENSQHTTKLKDGISIKGSSNFTSKEAGINIQAIATDKGFEVKLSDTLTNMKGITFAPTTQGGASVSLTSTGLDNGGNTITNVAAGVNDTDAVNVSQLKGLANATVNVDSRINRLGAQSAAMAGLRHLQYDPLEPTTLMAGVGTYKGQTALALGIAHYKNESLLFHAGASIGSNHDELMANAGVSWKFGSRADETAVKDAYRQGPISASYTLQDKVSALEVQNQMQKDEINELKAQLAEVLQYIKKG